jgi:hypothetical protein
MIIRFVVPFMLLLNGCTTTEPVKTRSSSFENCTIVASRAMLTDIESGRDFEVYKDGFARLTSLSDAGTGQVAVSFQQNEVCFHGRIDAAEIAHNKNRPLVVNGCIYLTKEDLQCFRWSDCFTPSDTEFRVGP